MKRMMLLFSVLSLLVVANGCGGGTSSEGNVGTSKVTISIDSSSRLAKISIEKDSLLAKAERLFMDLTGSGIAVAAIPSDVKYLVFTISAPDMVTITRTVDVAGQTTITETFTVPNGNNRHFLVEAKDASGNTLYQPVKEIFVNLDGQSVTITVDMADVAPPSFEGLASAVAVSPTQINLSWSAAKDNLTPAANMVYQIYRAETSQGQNFASPTYTTDAGATSFSVTGLQPNTTYFFVVRATDSNGNQGSSSNETWAQTLPPPDNPPLFEGLVSATYIPEPENEGPPMIDLSWDPATDDITAQPNIVYLIYYATTSGGQNLAVPNFTTAPGAESYSITGLLPGTYYFVVRARDETGNTDTNSIERLVDSEPPSIVSVFPPDPGEGSSVINDPRPVITVNFSESMDPATITSASFFLEEIGEGTVLVDGDVDYSENPATNTFTATFTPSNDLFDFTDYTATVTSAVTDRSGNPLQGDRSWSFTIDSDPPTINEESVYPVPGSTVFDLQPIITVGFSEWMAGNTISTASFILRDSEGNDVGGTVDYDGEYTATFTPSSDLTWGSSYTVIVTSGVTDLAGNHLEADYTWLFSIEEEPV